ncbi:MAG TPA: FCD domain-containing protein [Marmoricola sp.]|nr:FCD domain-containing protein [Marmoricola sp.]
MTQTTRPADAHERRPRPSLSDSLSSGILQIVREQGLTAGDPMPNAKALAERFDVATPTIREALRKLEATGSVELRHGSGVYVGANVSRILLANPHASAVSAEMVKQMVEARLMIEPSLAAMAAQRRLSAEDLDVLHHAVAEPGLADARTGRPVNFHREMANLAGNVVLAEVVDSLLSLRSWEQKQIRRLYDDREHDLAQHREILHAIESHDHEAAHELTRSHLEDIREVVSQRLDQVPAQD